MRALLDDWKYDVGQFVLAGDKGGAIERRSHNINHIPVYLVFERWWFESELQPAAPPCPV